MTGQNASWTIFSIRSERVLGALTEPHERHVGPLPSRDRPDLVDLDLARDHLVPQRRDDRRHQGEPIAPLVGDQHAEMLCFPAAHPIDL